VDCANACMVNSIKNIKINTDVFFIFITSDISFDDVNKLMLPIMLSVVKNYHK